MNKKLIKQLEGVGFASKVSGGIRISLEVKGGYAFDYYEGDDRIHFYKDNETVATSIESPMFAQIVAKVKDITGVDLAKKTKREEIEELKTGLKALVEKAEDSEAVFDARLKGYFMSIVDTVQAQGAKIETLEDAIKSQNKAVEVLEMHELEPAPKEQESLKDETKFKHDDQVVLIDKRHLLYCVNSSNILKVVIDRTIIDGFVLLRDETGEMHEVLSSWLEHAPAESPKEKALELGDWAETLVGKVNIPKGSKVLITLHLDLDNDFYCSTGQSDSHFEYYKPEELKPL